ncbi:hypothetical protein SAMN05421780_10512 [Flexibacter flexilis DSM 6793]|uniref:MoaF-like domain-containing protein n=1 Tax=Flexibacter flexilis DSM 6793 TaxID=927664 RepID=A0A1I1ILJ9_9BACT|nr:MoaF N-terminal domain-containing protein [Flexibacter flexilis]SFC37106.1 hypothetical protein SAMN05421780_10512 [Flexibacter flexilis DSM 6793]
MKKILVSFAVAGLFAACQPKHEGQTSTASTSVSDSVGQGEDYRLVGKNAVLEYPTFKAEVSYLTDSTLHWKTTSSDGKVEEGTEQVFLKKLNEHQYFLNWIEETGFTVSQVIDVKAGQVTAFGSFADAQSPRGQRSSVNLEGHFRFVK